MKVFVGLSGGVDSAVSALLLQEAGHEVTGVFMRNYTGDVVVDGEPQPCWLPEWRDAQRVAAHLKIPLLLFDFSEIYEREVLQYLYAEYAAGRTPNPDVICNRAVKFGPFLTEALAQGADFIATGHYAQVQNEPPHLWRAVDEAKDQTYFLHQVSAAALTKTLFPIGHLTKEAVREVARRAALPVAEKKDSTGICFVGEVPIKEFLRDKMQSPAGEIVTTGGEVIGQHDGLLWYTIGQRHGFGLTGAAEPLFVVEKNLATNQLVMGAANDPRLYSDKIVVKNARWINQPTGELLVRLRHRQPLQAVAKIDWQNETELIIHTAVPQRAVTPGQFAVLYNDRECFGGGEIV